ncbi:MAG: hypothetical protein K2H63_10090 [Paramuribaculum sp.]|nr:hypothetical protein [Paramuribaculum sp.]
MIQLLTTIKFTAIITILLTLSGCSKSSMSNGIDTSVNFPSEEDLKYYLQLNESNLEPIEGIYSVEISMKQFELGLLKKERTTVTIAYIYRIATNKNVILKYFGGYWQNEWKPFSYYLHNSDDLQTYWYNGQKSGKNTFEGMEFEYPTYIDFINNGFTYTESISSLDNSFSDCWTYKFKKLFP